MTDRYVRGDSRNESKTIDFDKNVLYQGKNYFIFHINKFEFMLDQIYTEKKEESKDKADLMKINFESTQKQFRVGAYNSEYADEYSKGNIMTFKSTRAEINDKEDELMKVEEMPEENLEENFDENFEEQEESEQQKDEGYMRKLKREKYL